MQTHAHARRWRLGGVGAEVPATSASSLDRMDRPPYNLGAKIRGAESCYLGAMIHCSELGVYFLKSF
jgi:hypothetical protein